MDVEAVQNLQSCIAEIRICMARNRLKLDDERQRFYCLLLLDCKKGFCVTDKHRRLIGS